MCGIRFIGLDYWIHCYQSFFILLKGIFKKKEDYCWDQTFVEPNADCWEKRILGSTQWKKRKSIWCLKSSQKLVEVRHRLGVHNVFKKSKIEASSLHQAADELIKMCVALSTKQDERATQSMAAMDLFPSQAIWMGIYRFRFLVVM